MIEEQGRVVAVDHDFVWVETIRQFSCSSCSARNGCGQYLSEKYKTGSSFSYIKATSPWLVKEGDRVVVGMLEVSFLRVSFLIYLFPLLLMMIGFWLSSLVGMADWLLLLIAGSFLLCGFGVVSVVGKRSADMCRVDVIRVLSSEDFHPTGGYSEQKFSFRND